MIANIKRKRIKDRGMGVDGEMVVYHEAWKLEKTKRHSKLFF